MGNSIGLYIAVVVFTRPDKTSIPLHDSSYHIVYQAVFIGNACFFEFGFEFILKNFLKDVFKTSVIGFHNRIFCRKIQWPSFIECPIHTRARKAIDRGINIIHRHGDSIFLEVIDFPCFGGASIIWCKGHRKFTFTCRYCIRCFVLISKSMTPDTNGLGPALYIAGYITHNNRLSKYGPSYNISNGAVRRAPHIGKIKFFYPIFIRGNSGTLDTYIVFLNRIGGLDRDLIFCSVS